LRNIFIIGLVVIAMGYMVSIMIGKYNTIIEEDKNKKALQQKQK
jgi:hypothetical protein